MRKFPTPLIAVLALAALVVFLIVRSEPPSETTSPPPQTEDLDEPKLPVEAKPQAGEQQTETPRRPPSPLSILASAPDWEELVAYQHTITRDDFEHLLTEIFTTGPAWRQFIEVGEDEALIRKSNDTDAEAFVLRFATPQKSVPSPRNWQSTGSLPVPPAARPLAGLHIALDPGHIGGEWAQIEERWFQIGNEKPVTEGDMTLFVAQLLRPRLEFLGARVSMVRDNAEPVTPLRPENLTELAGGEFSEDDPRALRRFAERLFYRTAEIRARADIVNEVLKPDLVLCLHFNAEGWGDPAKPTLVSRSHLHILLNGAYTDDEVRLADQRFAMLKKLLQRTHEEEALVGATVADTFAEFSRLPPFTYPPNSPNVRPVNNHPYLWARNLLANRLYDCPVIFMEPYVMNSERDYARIQAGDYLGLREVNGEMLPAIFREYTDALVEGLIRHYGK